MKNLLARFKGIAGAASEKTVTARANSLGFGKSKNSTPVTSLLDTLGKRIVVSETGCWIWLGTGEGRDFYGSQWFRGKKHKVHRLIKFLCHGAPTKPNALGCHKCDTPRCCNPEHVYWGDFKSNHKDMETRGRMVKEKGEDRYNSKLTKEAVEQLLRDAPNRKYGWGRAMAKKYGVGPTAINNVIRGRRWTWVKDEG